MDYPNKFKYKDGGFIVEFTSASTGTCVEVFKATSETPELGYWSDAWYSCDDTSHWVPVDDKSTKTKLHNAVKGYHGTNKAR